MRTRGGIIIWVALAACWAGWPAPARAAERTGTARVKFVRLIEKQVGEREVLGLVVRPAEGEGQATLLFGRASKVAGAARRLRGGQEVVVRFAVEEGRKWLTGLEPVREGGGDRDRERREGGERERAEGRESAAGRERGEGGERERAEGRERREADRGRGDSEEARREGRRREDRREGPREGRREGGGEARRAGPVERLADALDKLEQRLDSLEREIRDLRAENALLRKALGMKPRKAAKAAKADKDRREGEPRRREGDRREGEGPRPEGPRDGEGPRPEGRREGARDAAALPDGLEGFQGMLRGVIRRKGERSFVLKVEKLLRTWKGSRAPRPQAAIGRELTLIITPDSRLGERHLGTFGGLKVGDRVVVEAFHTRGPRLTVVEELRKAE